MSDNATISDLEGFFERFGWSFAALDDCTLRTGFRGENGDFAALVRVTDHWVIFTINPLLRPPATGWGRASLTTMAAANQAMHMAKLGIDPEDDAFLTVEMPSEGFTYKHFEESLQALGHAADQYTVPLMQARKIDELNG
jgi:hypothetical protein